MWGVSVVRKKGYMKLNDDMVTDVSQRCSYTEVTDFILARKKVSKQDPSLSGLPTK